VHLIRNTLRPVARKDRDAVAKELRKIYSAPNALALERHADALWSRPICPFRSVAARGV
jgi:transposase-like protein